jgi:hypothetical protein
VVTYFSWTTCVIQELCSYLEISCFIIPHSEQIDIAKNE